MIKPLLLSAFLLASPSQASVQSWIKSESAVDLKYYEIFSFVRSTVKWSKHNDIDPLLTLAVIHTESRFNKKAVSNKGAIGVMQVIPKWHPEEVKGIKLDTIDGGIKAGTTVLKKYIVKSKSVKGGLVRYSGGSKAYANKVLKTYNALNKGKIKV